MKKRRNHDAGFKARVALEAVNLASFCMQQLIARYLLHDVD